MPIFSLKNRELKKVNEATWPEAVDAGWLAEQIAARDILPEKLLVIGDWSAKNGAGGLIALDEDGSLVAVLLANCSPGIEWIEEADGLAWGSRGKEYADLNQTAACYFEAHGLTVEDLAEMHQRYFSYTEKKRPGRFNQSQRLFIIAPDFSRDVLTALKWRKLEVDTAVYRLKFMDIASGESLLSIDPVAELEGGRIASLVSALFETPSIVTKRLLGDARDLTHDTTSDISEKDAADRSDPSDLLHEALGGKSEDPRGFVASRLNYLVALDSRPIKFEYAALGAMIALYIIAFSLITIRNHNNYGTFGFDLGIFDQGIWLLSRFKEPFITVRGLNMFGDHLSFILLLIAPLYRIWDDARLLLILQTAFLALGAVPVFLIARQKLSSRLLSLALAASYLLYPALEWVNSDHFHPESLATPLLLFAFYYAMRKKYVPFAIFSILAITTKEDIALIVMLLGIYIGLTGNRKVGFATAMLSLAWFFVGLKLILAHFNGAGFFYIQNYSRLGSTPAEVINSTLTKPGLVLSIIGEQRKLLYLLELLAPMAFFPLMNIETLLISLPALFSNLVSQQGYMDSIQYHYTATIIPFIFVSGVLAIEKLGLKARDKVLMAGLIIVVALVSNYYLSPSPLSPNFNDGYWTNTNARKGSIDKALSLIPKDATVSAYCSMVPHLTHRQKVYEFPNPFMTVNWGVQGEHPHKKSSIQYVVVDIKGLTGEQRLLVEKLEHKDFRQVFDRDEILVLKKR